MRRSLRPALILGLLIGLGTATYATLIGVNGLNRRPRTKYSTGNVAYDAATGILLLNASPTDTQFATGVPRLHAAAPPSTLQIQMQILDVFGTTYQGLPPAAFIMEGSVDVNNNGTIDAGEMGVMLTGDLVEFGFNNSPPSKGSDSVDFRFTVTGGYLAPFYAGQNAGAFGTLAQPNNWASPPGNFQWFAESFSSALTNGSVMPIKCGVAIGDYVWHDVNADGIQDAGEPGINGVGLILRDENGNVVATTITGVGPMNQQGFYQFQETIGFCAGTWTVEVDLSTVPPGFVPTTVNAAGSNSTNDSNPSPSTVVLATDISKDQTHDFGFSAGCDGRVGDFVWHDLDRDGIQGAGEPGLDGVKVELIRASDNIVVGTTTTAAGGAYEFTGLCDDAYIVQVDASTLPAGFTPATSNAAGSTADNDSNGSPAPVTLSPGNRDNQSIDFGYTSPCTGMIGDFVWYDVNQNGIQDAGEPGIDGVTVTLTDGAGNVTTTTTGPNGFYSFTGLCPGAYRVAVDESTLPPGRTPALVNAGAPDVDSDANPVDVTIGDGQNESTIDFGYVAPCAGRIGDFVWHDENRNGIQDAGEAGFAGVTVNLRKASDNSVIQTDIAGADGAYMFEGLCPGSYIVEAVPPAGTTASPVGQGGNPATDSNPNMYGVTLPADNSQDLTVDFGFYCTGEIGDFVWHDVDGNGLQDAGEPGIAGAVITLTDAHGHTSTTTTNASGHYLFTGLCTGTFTIAVAAPADYQSTIPEAGADRGLDSNTNPTTVTLLANNSIDLTLDFGFMKQSFSNPGTGTPGYWKNHPNAWPVASIVIGGSTYTKAQAIKLMGTPPKGDNTYTMFRHLVSAKLNVLAGNDPSCIESWISQGDAWMATYPVGSKPPKSAWTAGAPIATTLDAYNNGRMCAPHRD